MKLDETWWARVLGGSGGDLHAASGAEQYVLLPRAGEPRVVVDSSCPKAMRDAVDRFMNKQGAVAAGFAGGASAMLSRRRPGWRVASDSYTLREYLSDALGQEVRLSIAVGPQRPNQKPIVRCYAGSELVAVAKMGPDPHTAALIENETDWLQLFGDEPFGEVATPTVIHAGEFGGSPVLVMSPFEIHGTPAMSVADIPLRALRELTERFGDDRSIRDGLWWEQFRNRLPGPPTGRYARIASDLDQDDQFMSIGGSAWHGDWSPWNMGKLDDGRLMIWDWERATVGVPSGIDLLHLHYQYGDGLADARPGLSQLGIADELHEPLMVTYLLELTARHGEAGVLQGKRQELVDAKLSELLGADSHAEVDP